VFQLLVIATVVHSWPILVTLKLEGIRSSENIVLIRSTCRRIPEDGIPHSHRLENAKSYI
jgi:hypothetical protein